jgi:hypothetical protein
MYSETEVISIWPRVDRRRRVHVVTDDHGVLAGKSIEQTVGSLYPLSLLSYSMDKYWRPCGLSRVWRMFIHWPPTIHSFLSLIIIWLVVYIDPVWSSSEQHSACRLYLYFTNTGIPVYRVEVVTVIVTKHGRANSHEQSAATSLSNLGPTPAPPPHYPNFRGTYACSCTWI